jgi:hypothetical protein
VILVEVPSMSEHRAPGESEAVVAVGQELGPDVAPDEVLRATVKERADDSQRYIAYSSAMDGNRVENCWLSVDLDVVVPRELLR